MPADSRNETASEEVCLLARIAVGDSAAFRQLYARYSAPLFSLAIRMVGDAGEAEELLQDAFVKLWRAAPTFDPAKSRPFTWAVTIMRRLCIDHLRKQRTRAPISAASDSLEFAADRSQTPRATTIAHEDAERVRQALDVMPAAQRRALELGLFSGLTHEQIAERLQQPVGSVKSWIRRGLLDLKSTLKDISHE